MNTQAFDPGSIQIPMPIDIADHYWNVGGVTYQVYSSKTNTYVLSGDPEFAAWLGTGRNPIPIATEADIWPSQKDIKPAWLFNGTTFAQPTANTYTKEQLIAYAKEVRWLNETGGITVAAVQVETDDRSKGLVSQQRLAAMNDMAGFATDWQAVDNSTHAIDGATMVALADAVAAHVNSCFLQFATAEAEINAGVIVTTEQVDTKMSVPSSVGFLDLTRKRRKAGK